MIRITHTFGVLFSMKSLSAHSSIRFGVHAKGLQQGPMALVQSSAIVAGGEVRPEYLARTAPEAVRFREEDLLRQGDVLLVAKGASNLAAVWPGSHEDSLASSMLFVIRPDQHHLLPEFLAAFLNSRPAQAQMAQYLKPGSAPVLSRAALDRLAVPVPSLPEQQRMVALATSVQGTVQGLQQLSDTYAQLLNTAWANFTER